MLLVGIFKGMIMKTAFIKLITLMFTTALLFTGCSEDSSTSTGDSLIGSTQATSDIYGTWVYVDNGTKLEVLSSSAFDYTTLGENLLEVTTSNGTTRHLLRASVANTNTSGSVVDGTTASLSPKLKGVSSRAISGIGGIEIILRNSTDNGISTTTYTQSDGIFTDTTLPSGTYSITGSDGTDSFTTEVTLDGKNTELGNFQLPDAEGYNFKTELILDNEYIYADGALYSGYVRVHNIGSQKGLGLAYDVTMDDYYKKSFTASIILGSLVAGDFVDIPINFSINPLPTPKRTIAINTLVRDVNGNSWEDSFNIKVFRRNMDINIASASASVKGYAVMEGYKVLPFETSSSTITLPVDPEVKYSVILSNPDIEEETAYSIGVETETLSYEGFNQPIAFEPNNSEEEATLLNIKSAEVAYLHRGDIDFWDINMSGEKDDIINTLLAPIMPKMENADINTTYEISFQFSRIFEQNDNNNEETISVTNAILLKNDLIVTDNNATFRFEDNVTIKIHSSPEFYTKVEGIIKIGTSSIVHSITTKFCNEEWCRDENRSIVHHTGLNMYQDVDNSIQRTYLNSLIYCDELTLGGFTDWRMASIAQYKTLVNSRETYPYRAIDIFKNTPTYLHTFWSYDSTEPPIDFETLPNSLYVMSLYERQEWFYSDVSPSIEFDTMCVRKTK